MSHQNAKHLQASLHNASGHGNILQLVHATTRKFSVHEKVLTKLAVDLFR